MLASTREFQDEEMSTGKFDKQMESALRRDDMAVVYDAVLVGHRLQESPARRAE